LVEFFFGDVGEPDVVRRGMEGCERVCHLAAIVGHRVSEAEWWRVNRDGTRNVLQAALDLGIHSVVHVSSMAVLGPTRPGEVADERRSVDVRRYVTLYQKTKRAGDDLAREFAVKGLSVKIAYPAVGYGCSRASSHPSLAEMTLLRMASGKPVAIIGTGRNRLCLSYYRDTADGIRLAHERGKAGEGYILGGENLTFREIWAVVAEILGRKPPRWRVPVWLLRATLTVGRLVTLGPLPPAEILELASLDWCFSSAKAQQRLGWRPHDFRDGMAETWSEYRASGWTAGAG
jgi:nucleoside-diphosphate-sugar epimerase